MHIWLQANMTKQAVFVKTNLRIYIFTLLKNVISQSVFLIPKGYLMGMWEWAIMKLVTSLASAAETVWWLGNYGRTTSVSYKDVSLYLAWILRSKDLAIY